MLGEMTPLVRGSVIVRDEILYRIVWKEALKFATQLCSQGFVVGDDQRRLLNAFDELRHGKGFPGTGGA